MNTTGPASNCSTRPSSSGDRELLASHAPTAACEHRPGSARALTRGLRRSAGLAIGLAACVAMGGCSSWFGGSSGESGMVGGKNGQPLSSADFSGPVPASAEPVPQSTAGSQATLPSAPATKSPTIITEAQASEGIVDITASAGSPVAIPGAAVVPVESAVLVDAKVGDVNGRAVYATQFLAPLSARFEAESKQMPLREWRDLVRREVSNRVDEFIIDELLAAEALNNLTPEQKQGFFAFVQNLSEGLRRESGGTLEGTEARLANEQGITLAEWQRTERQKALIRQQFSDKIIRRINVSWRDIQQAYNRRNAEFNPPPKLTFRLILVRKSDQAGVDAITKALADGTPFAEVAKLNPNRFSSTGGKQERTIKGTREETSFFPNDDIDKLAKTLPVGSFGGPIEWDRDVAWIQVESLNEKKVSLYEAQRVLEESLFQSKGLSMQEKYVGRLRERASMTDTSEMVNRLAKIAEERFWKPGPGGEKPVDQ